MSAKRLKDIRIRLEAAKKQIDKYAQDEAVAKAKPDNGLNRCYGHNVKLRHASQLDISTPSKLFYDACDNIIRNHPDARLKGQALKYIRKGGRTESYERQCARLLLEHMEKLKVGRWTGEYLTRLNLYEVSQFVGG